ncbi:hypothetical protein ANO14919_081550 [Xylariales sp. No.14919]|nr:hypothetical protein ANO14919_081550 [Xylariales sp. No.14919]
MVGPGTIPSKVGQGLAYLSRSQMLSSAESQIPTVCPVSGVSR